MRVISVVWLTFLEMPGIIGGVVFFVFIKSLSNLVYHSACMFLLFLLVSCPLQHHHSSSKLDEIPSDVKIVYENNTSRKPFLYCLPYLGGFSPKYTLFLTVDTGKKKIQDVVLYMGQITIR